MSEKDLCNGYTEMSVTIQTQRVPHQWDEIHPNRIRTVGEWFVKISEGNRQGLIV